MGGPRPMEQDLVLLTAIRDSLSRIEGLLTKPNQTKANGD